MTKTCASVKWYPRLFTGDMVRALLDGKKTATRWPLRKQPVEDVSRRAGQWVWEDVAGNVFRAPVCPGDVIWGRETWARVSIPHGTCARELVTVYAADNPHGLLWPSRWKPNIHMPRKYARLFGRVTGVKLVRVQDISEEEAQAEGITPSTKQIVKFGRGMRVTTARQQFAALWNALYAARGLGWDANPWVWAADFRLISKAEAEA